MIQVKTDLAKSDPNYYKVTTEPDVRELDAYYYVTIGGKSAPEDERFQTAIQTIYAINYGIKFLCKAEDNDFVVPKMECYWFIEGGAEKQEDFMDTPREEWCWKIVFRMPDFVEQDHFFRAVENAKSKKPTLDFSRVKFEMIEGGPFVQVLHIGSYEEEAESLQKIHALLQNKQLKMDGYHREIYLSDPFRVAVEKRKTILRYRVK